MTLSFRWRLVLFSTLTVALALALVGGLLVYSVQRGYLDAIDNDLRLRAEGLLRMPPPGRRFDEVGGPPGPPPGMGQAQFFRPDGRSPRGDIVPVDPQAVTRPVAPGLTWTTVSDDQGRIRVLTMGALRPEQPPLWIQVATRLDEYDRLVGTQFHLIFVLVPAALIVAFASGWVLASNALAPIVRLTRAASGISEEDLSTRLPVTGDDELGALSSTFNAMMGRLESSFAQRAALVERLQDALDRQRRFVADASHELRTPLTRIKLVTSAALAQEGEGSELAEALRVANSGADSMEGLVAQLLDLARLDSAPERPKEVVDLAAAARAAAAEALLDEPILDLGEARVMGDPVAVARALVNVMTNARRFSPAPGSVTVRVNIQDGAAVARVEDSGPGVPDAELERVTDRFYRGDKARTREDGGTGLGLAITKEIVEAHGGVLSLENRAEGGLAVEVRLPAASHSS